MKKITKILMTSLLMIAMSLPMSAIDITVGGKVRNYLEYIPANLGTNRPLLISCHGMNQDAAYQKGMLSIESVADTAKFAVVFPNGINKGWDISGDTDINFILALIDRMAAQYQIDRNRVYLSGFSMGGMLTYHAMNLIADKIAAFAPISGYPLYGGTFTSSRPIPIIHTHGNADDVCVFSKVQGILDGWIKRNNCPTTEIKTTAYKGARGVTRHYWGPGDKGVEVVLMELDGKGHWISNDGIKTGEEIWNFCKRYSLKGALPTAQIEYPRNGHVFVRYGGNTAVDSITVRAKAEIDSGKIAKVQYYNGSILLGSSTDAPYQFVWKRVKAGQHALKVIATDTIGNTAMTYSIFSVTAPQTEYNLSSGFSTAGSIPVGWTTYDGADKRVGGLTDMTNGCRTIALTGATRDFDNALYFRNTTGKSGDGVASYGAEGSLADMRLSEGYYTLQFTAAHWNNAFADVITVQVTDAKTGQVIASTEVAPTANLANSAATSFSGTTPSTLQFHITVDTPVVITFQTADKLWADALITNIKLLRSTTDPATAVSAVTVSDKKLIGTAYRNLQGSVVVHPRGLVFRTQTYQDGSSKTEKMIR
jgi:poly(3-hydroxybutyrate) depolymerase